MDKRTNPVPGCEPWDREKMNKPPTPIPMKEYNETTARKGKGSVMTEPRLSFQKTGSFRINSLAVRLLGIKKGHGIIIVHDEKEGEWYIRSSEGGIRTNIAKQGYATFFSIILADDLKETTGKASGSMRIVKEPTTVQSVMAYNLLVSATK